jgi:bacterioferritin-associated ferredoxin
MWVCYCNQVREKTIRHAIREGACTVRCIARATRAGTTCGGCRPSIAAILTCEQASLQAERPVAGLAPLESPAP